MSSPSDAFDVVVLGAGPAGEIAADRLVQGGRKVAVVERELVGGECSYWACMPSKSLLRPAEALEEARRVPGAAQAATGNLDVQAVLDRRDEVIHDLDDSEQLPWLEDRGIALFRGAGRLDGQRRVRVGDTLLTAEHAVIIAVGSGALFPPIPGLAEAGAWSNREITTAKEVPARLAVLGGGVVGVEMAMAWSSLGAKVTVIEALDRLIANEEPVAAQELLEGLQERGVDVKLGAKATEVDHGDGQVTVTLETGERISAQHLLVAIGRKPHTAGLGLESVGLPADRFVEVDDHMRVPGHKWLYAIGDANGRSLLTHEGKYHGRIAADNILGHEAVARSDRAGSPRVIFTSPQVAAVGLTLEKAQDKGLPVRAFDLSTSGTAGASFYGRDAAGTTRFVVDTDRHVLVGVTYVGAEVADFLQAATIAVAAEVPLTRIAHAVAPFPTRSELWLNFINAYEAELGLSLHAVEAPVPLGT